MANRIRKKGKSSGKWGLGLEVQGLRLQARGLALRIPRFRPRVSCLGFNGRFLEYALYNSPHDSLVTLQISLES